MAGTSGTGWETGRLLHLLVKMGTRNFFAALVSVGQKFVCIRQGRKCHPGPQATASSAIHQHRVISGPNSREGAKTKSPTERNYSRRSGAERTADKTAID